jgi:hypothetical protein
MPIYIVNVAVEVAANSQTQAYGYIGHALKMAKQQEVVYLDAEVIETRPDEDDDVEAAHLKESR